MADEFQVADYTIGGATAAPGPRALNGGVAQWEPQIQKYAKQHGVDPDLVRAVMDTESSGNPAAISRKKAIGLMQLMPATARGLGVNPADPEQNIEGGVRLLRDALKKHGGDETMALREYQGGPDTKIWGKENAAYPGLVLSRLGRSQQSVKTDAGDEFAVADYTLPEAAPAPKGSFASDVPKLLASGSASGVVAPLAWLANTLSGGLLDRAAEALIGRGLQDTASDAAQYWIEKLTPETKQSLIKKYLSEKDGEYIGEALKDPRKVAADVLTNLPQLAASIVPGFRIARGAATAAGAKAVAGAMEFGLGKEAAIEWGKDAAVRAGTKAASIVGSVTEGVMGGSQQAVQARDEVLQMPREKLLTTDYAKELQAQGVPENEIRQRAAERAAQLSAVIAGPVDALLGGLGSRYLGKLATGGTGRGKAAVMGTLSEGLTEGPQSAAEQLASNLAVKRYADPNKQLSEGVAEQAVGGAVVGAAIGGGSGAILGGHGTTPANAPNAAPGAPAAAGPAVAPRGAAPLSAPPAGSKPYIENGQPVPGVFQTADGQLVEVASGAPAANNAAQAPGAGQPPLQPAGTPASAPSPTPATPAAPNTSPAPQEHNPGAAVAPGQGGVENNAGVHAEAPRGPGPEPAPGAGSADLARATNVAYTPSGTKVESHWAVIDARDVDVSHDITGTPNPNFNQKLQKRDLGSAAAISWIHEKVGSFKPELLGDSNDAGTGAPIISPEPNKGGRPEAETGRKRILLLRQVYAKHPEKAAAYRTWLSQEASVHGIDPASMHGMEQPMLVRIRQTPMSDEQRVEFAGDADTPAVMGMSKKEQAKIDAGKITPEMMARFNVPEGGDILAGSNHGFVNQFLTDVVGPNARAQLVDDKGLHRPELADRIENALFARALNDDEFLDYALGSRDPLIKNILRGLTHAGLELSEMDGVPKDLDLRPHLIGAANLIRNARLTGQDVLEAVNQNDLVQQRHFMVDHMARFFVLNQRSPKRMGEYIAAVARFITTEINMGRAGDMFGGRPLPDFNEAVKRAHAAFEAKHGIKEPKQTDIFAGPRSDQASEVKAAGGEQEARQPARDQTPARDRPVSREQAPVSGGPVAKPDARLGQDDHGHGQHVEPAPAPKSEMERVARSKKETKTAHIANVQAPAPVLPPAPKAAFERIAKEAADIAKGIEAAKARAMIYQVEQKEEVAKARNLPLDSYHTLPFEKWGEVWAEYSRQQARKDVDPNPSPDQIDADNYAKGHITWSGERISIETAKGGIRRSQPGGPKWEVTMPVDYGHIIGTVGADGDPVDVFIGPKLKSENVWVIDQQKLDGTFDEHKAMVGFDSFTSAMEAYDKAFSDGKADDRMQAVEPMTLEQFKTWLDERRTKSPLASIAPDYDHNGVNRRRGESDLRAELLALYDTGKPLTLEQLARVKEIQAALRDAAGAKLNAGVLARRTDPLAHIAYHGGASQHERFSTDYIGTGEGAQVYGWGLYFAAKKAIAQFYRDKLSNTIPGAPTGKSRYQIRGVPFPDGRSGHAALDTALDIDSLLGYTQMRSHDMADVVRANIERRIENWKQSGPQAGSAAEDMNALVAFYEGHVKNAIASDIVESPKGFLYEVDLAPKEDQYLLWERALSGQSDVVKAALAKGRHKIVRQALAEDWTGQKLYNELTQAMMPPDSAEAVTDRFRDQSEAQKEASQYLNALGVPGLKYLDASSRTPGAEASHNYVIFDDTLVHIRGLLSIAAARDAAAVTPAAQRGDIQVSSSAQRILDNLGYHVRPRVNVVSRVRDLPAHLKGVHERTRGLFDRVTGEIYLIGENLTPDTVPETLLHELEAHFGLRNLLGEPALDRALAEVYATRKDDIMRAAKDGFLAPYGFDFRNTDHQLDAAEEYIAHFGESRIEPTLFQRLVASIREGLRKLGFVKQWSDGDIVGLLARSRAALKATGSRQTTVDGMPMPNALASLSGDGLGGEKVKFDMDAARMSRLLGPQLYGDMSKMADVTIKELFQNSFDAVKAAIEQRQVAKGKIDVKVDRVARTIELSDNGTGMGLEQIKKAFLTVAGTQKESSRSSGGFGIAKMLFLVGNESLTLRTVKDGVARSLETTGEQLLQSFNDAGAMPTLTQERTDEPNGTRVVVTVPPTYLDQNSGEMKSIDMPYGDPAVLERSPLFENIDVSYNGIGKPIGANLPDTFVPLTTVKFQWGTARLVISKSEVPISKYSDNVQVLSNGLWQFSRAIKEDPFSYDSVPIPRKIFVNIEPNADVKPEHPSYPFSLNRQEFARSVSSDIEKIFNYVSVLYGKDQAAETAQGFGELKFVESDGRMSTAPSLKPKIAPAEKGLKVNADDKMEVREGRVYLNGKQLPEITREAMAKMKVDLSKFRIDQALVDADRMLFHENTKFEDGKTLSDVARKQFGKERFDRFVSGMAHHFMVMRDMVVKHGGASYEKLAQLPVGVSFDVQYRGVHVTVPFRAMFINPAATIYKDTRRAAYGMAGTMAHEIAHFRVMSHDADFAAEMQNIDIILSSAEGFDYTSFRNTLTAELEFNRDIFEFLHDAIYGEKLKPLGKQLKDGGQSESRYAGADGNAPGGRDAGSGRAEQPLLHAVAARDPGSAGPNGYGAASGRVSRAARPLASIGPAPAAGIREVYGINPEGRIWGYAVRAGDAWNVKMRSVNPSMQGEWQSAQAASMNEVKRFFHTAGLEFRIYKPPREPMPDALMFGPFDVPTTSTTRAYFNKTRQLLQDRMLKLRDIQDAIRAQGGRFDEASDAYLAEERYHGIAAAKLEDLEHELMQPLVDTMQKNAISLEQADQFLYARHAPERNAYIAQIDPSKPAGSGMSDETAANIMRGYGYEPDGTGWRSSGEHKGMDQIAQLVDRMNDERLATMVSKGLIDEETRLRLKSSYQFYVPLRGREDLEETPGTAKGFSLAGKELKKAFGRRSQAKDILAYTVAQAQVAIIRGEKNEVGRTFFRLVQSNPNEQLWQINRVEWKPYIDKDTGEVNWAADRFRRFEDNELSVKVDGQEHVITILDPDLARGLKTFGVTAPTWVRGFAWITNYIATVNTALNPEFVVSNFIRDLQTAGINVGGEKGAKLAAQMMKDIPAAIRGFWQFERNKGPLPADASTWHRYAREYSDAGGRVAFLGLRGVEETRENLASLLKDLNPNGGRRAFMAIRGLGRFIMDVNGAVENAMRLSLFVNSRKAGYSTAQAASMAKNVTVNFNRRGELGSAINAFYAFYNASIQGSARLAQALLHSRKVQILALAIVALAAWLDWLNRALAGIDRDGMNRWDKIPDYVKERNIVIMRGDGSGDSITLPMPYGYNTFMVIGQSLSALMHGAEKPGKTASRIFSGIMGSFNPLGGNEGGTLQMISPSFLDPFVQHGLNKSFFGGPIHPEQPPFGAKKPESELFWKKTPQIYVDTARELNELTGGNEVRAGQLSVSPNIMQHYIRSFFGGAGEFWARSATGVLAMGRDEQVAVRETPFVRRLYREPADAELSQRFYENVNSVRTAREEFIHYMKIGKGDYAREQLAQHMPEFQMYGDAEKVGRQLQDLRKSLRAIQVSQTMTPEDKKERSKVIQTSIDNVMKDFNKRFLDRTRAAAETQ